MKQINKKILTNNIVKKQYYANADQNLNDKNGVNFIKNVEFGKNTTPLSNLNFDIFINNMIQDEVQTSESKVDLNY